MDLVKRPKTTWIHKDSVNRETYTQPIQEVQAGDLIEFTVNIISLQGFISDIKWEGPQFSDTPAFSVANYNKDVARQQGIMSLLSFKQPPSVKIFCDLNRICEVEDAVVEWYEELYY